MVSPSTETLRRHAAALNRLSRGGRWRTGRRDEAIREIAEVSAEAMTVQRVGIWLFVDDNSAIECVTLYETGVGHSQVGTRIEAADFPRYFEALGEQRVIAAHDAVHDERTSDLAGCYLEPHSISALLDVPIISGRGCIGVVCHEHVGEAPREWSSEEQAFAASIADFVALGMEVSERVEVEQRLKRSEAELRAALDASRLGTWRWNIRDDSVTWSFGTGRLYGEDPGWSPTNFEEYAELIHEADRLDFEARLRRSLDDPSCHEHDSRHRIFRRDGELRWIEARAEIVRDDAGAPLMMNGTVMDVTERQELEDQLAQSQKLEAVGRLAGGVAHDFNNLLTVIRGYAEMLRDDIAGDEPAEAKLKQIQDAASRASTLTAQMLAFARRQPVEPVLLDVGERLATILEFLPRLIGEDVTLAYDRCDEPALVTIDPSQFEQVLLNLATNARDAMPSGGRLTVALSVEETRADQRVVRVRVTDTGNGMSDETRSKVFEPFFSTKGPGHGTGLGLATAYGIVTRAGGTIEVESEPGHGTTFTLTFPEAASGEIPPFAPSGPRRKSSSASAQRPARVLVVEDDSSVRELVRQSLQFAGYFVLTAGSGEGAKAVLESEGSSIDLVVSDLIMPQGGGPEVLQIVEQLGLDCPVAFMTGYSDEVALRKRGLPRGAKILRKPFSTKDLLRFVRASLSDSPQSS